LDTAAQSSETPRATKLRVYYLEEVFAPYRVSEPFIFRPTFPILSEQVAPVFDYGG
jgi:hypothetical protein